VFATFEVPKYPTLHNVFEIAVMLTRWLNSLLGLGLGTTFHCLPSHRSIS